MVELWDNGFETFDHEFDMVVIKGRSKLVTIRLG